MKRSMTMTHSWVSSDNQWRGIICWCCQLKIAKGNLLAKPHAGHFVCVRLSRLNTHKPHFSILRLWPTFGPPMHRKTGCHTLELKGIYTAKFFVLLLLSFVCSLLWPAERTVQNHRASRSHQSSFFFFFLSRLVLPPLRQHVSRSSGTVEPGTWYVAYGVRRSREDTLLTAGTGQELISSVPGSSFGCATSYVRLAPLLLLRLTILQQSMWLWYTHDRRVCKFVLLLMIRLWGFRITGNPKLVLNLILSVNWTGCINKYEHIVFCLI